jgi:hypothetical protein
MGKREPREGEGRPSIFTKELGEEICRKLSSGLSLRQIEKEEDMPAATTVYYWLLDEDKKEFLKQYNVARQIQSELEFEQLDEMAEEAIGSIVGDDKSDGARVAARKLQIDTKKWALSKKMPKKYGDKLDLTSDGEKLPTPIYGGISTKKEDKEV